MPAAAAALMALIALCPSVELTRPIEPDLSDTEKRLVCGKIGDERSPPGWNRIPLNQKQFNFRSFLQTRGYHHPQFWTEKETLVVDPGPITRVTKIEMENAPRGFSYERMRDVVGAALTPATLNTVEKWGEARLGGLGYACASVRTTADPETGIIHAVIEPGLPSRFGEVEEDEIPGLEHGILRRYDAFRTGDPYDGDLLDLTGRRAQQDATVESLRLAVKKCENDQVALKQVTVPGPPRLLSFGAGANTEGKIIARASWNHTRLGHHASILNFTAQASGIDQFIDANLSWFFDGVPSRQYLRPAVSLRHLNQTPYEVIQLRAETTWGSSVDFPGWRVDGRVGPAGDRVQTLQGIGPPNVAFLSILGSIEAFTHEWEFYRASPRAGAFMYLNALVNDRHVVSQATGRKLDVGFESAWNLHQADPPQWVFAFRTTAGATFPDVGDPLGFALPANWRRWLGGSRDVRGFGLLEVPANGLGALTRAYAGVEIRYAEGLPLWTQPFIFLDAGMLGAEAATLDLPVYWSPGFGARWQTPVGNFRLNVAHGFITGGNSSLSHWQLYFSFGEEF